MTRSDISDIEHIQQQSQINTLSHTFILSVACQRIFALAKPPAYAHSMHACARWQ